MTEEEIIKNLKTCSRFQRCSINICPLDPEAELRNKLPEEESCPFTIKKRNKAQRRLKLRMPNGIFKIVPKSNIKLLNKRNQKRWHAFHHHQKDEKEKTKNN